jgi:hypothetical protein
VFNPFKRLNPFRHRGPSVEPAPTPGSEWFTKTWIVEGRPMDDLEAAGHNFPPGGVTFEMPAIDLQPGESVDMQIRGDQAVVTYRQRREQPTRATCGTTLWGPGGWLDMKLCGEPAAWHGADGLWRCERHAREVAKARSDG